MSIWILQLVLTPEEEAKIQERSDLPLPFEGLPDLSLIGNEKQLRHLLQALHPEEPPEAISRRLEPLWHQYSSMHAEDIIAVPLATRKEMALAEVTGKYHYGVGVSGEDVHLVPVKWHTRRVPNRVWRKHKEILKPRKQALREIANPEVRTIIRDRLPYSYNRFVKWKWLLGLFFLMGLLRMVHMMLKP